jgi:hypothetical protein
MLTLSVRTTPFCKQHFYYSQPGSVWQEKISDSVTSLKPGEYFPESGRGMKGSGGTSSLPDETPAAAALRPELLAVLPEALDGHPGLMADLPKAPAALPEHRPDPPKPREGFPKSSEEPAGAKAEQPENETNRVRENRTGPGRPIACATAQRREISGFWAGGANLDDS